MVELLYAMDGFFCFGWEVAHKVTDDSFGDILLELRFVELIGVDSPVAAFACDLGVV